MKTYSMPEIIAERMAELTNGNPAGLRARDRANLAEKYQIFAQRVMDGAADICRGSCDDLVHLEILIEQLLRFVERARELAGVDAEECIDSRE